MLLKIYENSQENTCTRVSFLIKLQRPATLSKKRLWHRCFPVNFGKFLRTSNLQNTSRRLLLAFWNPVKVLRWTFSLKQGTAESCYFCKKSYLRCFTGFSIRLWVALSNSRENLLLQGATRRRGTRLRVF